MKNLEEIIEFENENTELDFKAIQYEKSNFENLLKDLISMANAKTNNEIYIITGVKHKPNGQRQILGIESDFIDDSTYQQLVNSNVEPELNFEYFPFEFQNKKLGVFKIFDSSNPPYMMKKSYGKLKIGESFIRKGSHQTRVTRKDFDYFIDKRCSIGSFNGEIAVYFNTIGNKEYCLKQTPIENIPSEKARKKILKAIQTKEDAISKTTKTFLAPILDIDTFIPGVPTPYEKRSINTLKDNLKNIEETYKEDDIYYIYEESAHKFNFTLLNKNDSYLEDAMIEIRINKSNLIICHEVHSKPIQVNYLYGNYSPPIDELSYDRLNYPNVKESENEYIVTENIGDLKHQIEQSALNVPLRMLKKPNVKDNNVKIQIKIFGKNLKEPIRDELYIKITD